MNCERKSVKKTPHFRLPFELGMIRYTNMSERTCAMFVGNELLLLPLSSELYTRYLDQSHFHRFAEFVANFKSIIKKLMKHYLSDFLKIFSITYFFSV